MRLGVVRQDGRPLVTPAWFLFEEDTIYFTPRERSEWFECLRLDARISLCIDEQILPYRKIIFEGTAELIFDTGDDDHWRELYERLTRRYISEKEAATYLRNTLDQPRALYCLKLTESAMKTWRMPLEDESPRGIWHRRYYKPGSKFASAD